MKLLRVQISYEDVGVLFSYFYSLCRIKGNKMNLCKTCKHWQTRKEDQSGYTQGLGRCGAAPMLSECTDWDAIKMEHVIRKDCEHIKAFAQDYSDYEADLLTKPDFGCVSHEDNEKDLKCFPKFS